MTASNHEIMVMLLQGNIAAVLTNTLTSRQKPGGGGTARFRWAAGDATVSNGELKIIDKSCCTAGHLPCRSCNGKIFLPTPAASAAKTAAGRTAAPGTTPPG